MLSKIISQKDPGFQQTHQTIEISHNMLFGEANKYLTRKNDKIFETKNWFLDKGKFRCDYWFQIMPLIIELIWCEELHLFKNNEQSIINSLIYTRFKALRNLTLDHNCIKNIEAISFLDAPNLKYLSLQNNQITKLSPLIKTNFKKILIVQIYNNPIVDVDSLQRTNYPRISEFNLAHMNPRSEGHAIHTFLEDASVLVKLKHFEKYKNKRGSHVIEQRKVQQKIQYLAFNAHHR